MKKIKLLKNLGIFSDFNADSSLNEFLKFNLFYGWNGSGKTTLSKFFYSLQEGERLPNDLILSEFKIQIDGQDFTHDDPIELTNLNVFNEDFIKGNIDWDNKIESILLISKSKISEKEDLDKKRDNQKEKKKGFDEKNTKITKLNDLIDKELQNKSRDIKNSFKSISPEDKYYFGYDKKKFRIFLEENKSTVFGKSRKQEELDLLKLIERIKPNEKEVIDFTFKVFDINDLREAERKIENLLNASLSGGVISRLKENSDIAAWIERGLEIHEEHGEKNCEFCGNVIDSEHLKKLKKHFSDELNLLRDKIEKAKEWIEENLIIEEINLGKELFYQDIERGFLDGKNDLGDEIKSLNTFFTKWKELLEEKFKNPSKEIFLVKKISDSFLIKYEEKKKVLDNIISSHNKRVRNFDTEFKQNQKKLELHYATEFEEDFNYFEKLQKIKTLEAGSQTLKLELEGINKEIFDLNVDLSNEELGADEFNKTLAKFIGHNEIELKFNQNLQGYEINRTYHDERAKNLSEGEKTAIAFVFFITKLKEKNSLNNEIIVLDDPVSSFDSNNLFSAYSFIKSELEQVKQLFILTHNFTFFRLIRDWFKVKNKKNKKSEFFQIEILPVSPRESVIKNIDTTLLNYDSEYHYVFSKLYKFKNDISLNLEKSFQAANLSRKLLESFLSFKFPQKRNDFRLLLSSAISDSQQQEKIYKFISKYSHLPIDHYENAENNLIGESENIIKEIFEIIEKLDKPHYDEMVLVSI